MGENLSPFLPSAPGFGNVCRASPEDTAAVVAVLMNAGLTYNWEQMFQDGFLSAIVAGESPAAGRPYRYFNALVVEEAEGRSLKIKSISTTEAKWLLL